jgi:hypothetical protein
VCSVGGSRLISHCFLPQYRSALRFPCGIRVHKTQVLVTPSEPLKVKFRTKVCSSVRSHRLRPVSTPNIQWILLLWLFKEATEADKYLLDATLSLYDVQLETSTLFRHFNDRILDLPLVLTAMLFHSTNSVWSQIVLINHVYQKTNKQTELTISKPISRPSVVSSADWTR